MLVCPDKFKGTLTATEAAEALARGWRAARPQDTLELLPVSDGGDGFGELLGRHFGAEPCTVETVDAAHRPLQAVWWWEPRQRLALIESARIIGLALLPPGQFHPFELDTFGLGAVLRAAAERQPRHTLIGIGGSATNDGGFGLARALGWEFRNGRNQLLVRLTQLDELVRLHPPHQHLRLGRLTVAVDVRNPLFGHTGCTRVFGPQKGLRPEDLHQAERWLQHLVTTLRRSRLRRPFSSAAPGTGAAGGLGFGLGAFLGAHLRPGFELFARLTGLARRVATADVVVTGEGALDLTTLDMGKGVGEIARLCRQRGRPCLALCGQVNSPQQTRASFSGVWALSPDLTTPEEAQREPARWLAELARRVAAQWTP